MKQKFLLVASLAVGLLAAVLAHAWLNAKNAEVEQLKADIRSRQQTVVILAAARALPRGATLKEGDLIPVRTLRAVTSSDNLGDGDQAFAYCRRLNHPVDPDDPILWSYLEGGRDSSRRLGEDVPTGKRAGGAPVNFAYHASQNGAKSYAISAVGNDEVACLEHDDIALDYIFGVDFNLFSVADNLCARG